MSARPAVAIGSASGDDAVAAALVAAMPGAAGVRLGGMPASAPWVVDPGALAAWLRGQAGRPVPRRLRRPLPARSRVATLPQGALLIVPSLAAWCGDLPAMLDRRRDLRVVALADWPSALDWPEYSAPNAAQAAADALAAMLARAALVVASDAAMAGWLSTKRGGAAVPIVVEPMPSALAGMPAGAASFDKAAPFMVAVGPLDARANTLLLLQLWRDAPSRQAPWPKLVLAGARAAQVEEIAPLLDWNEALRPVVAEAPGLGAAALRALVEGAQALLVPDFTPPDVALMRDALALGVPVIAAFSAEALALSGVTCLDPLDGPGWRVAIMAAASVPRRERTCPILPDWPGYAARLLTHAQALP